jgi:hypothetical protein
MTTEIPPSPPAVPPPGAPAARTAEPTTETAVEIDAGRPVHRVRVPLPEPKGRIAPVVARRMRRALAVYAVVWLLGVLPAALGAGPALTAAGLGLVLPGGGFLLGGAVVASAAALLVFVLSLVVWWFAGMTVLPPLVWLAAAALAGLVTGEATWPAARVAVPVVGPALLVLAYLVHAMRHRGQLRTRERINRRLADVEFAVAGPPALATGYPVTESTEADLGHLRYALDLALQPMNRFDGFVCIDQYREAALRYQIYALNYGLGMAQFTRTPAFSGYLAEAQRQAIEKILQRRVWGYWAAENAWGNLSLNRDPVGNRENIMLTGWHGVAVGLYEELNDDRYSRPGALTYRWSDTEAYPNDFGTLAASIGRNYHDWDFTLFPCEPNWIYSVCNTFGLNTLLLHDRLHGAGRMPELTPAVRESYEREFLRPDGRIVGVRAAHLGLSWNFWAGVAVQLNTTFWLNPAMPELAQRTWWLLRENAMTRDEQGRLTLPLAASDRLDPGNYRLGRDTFGQIAITMAAREIGDEECASAAQAILDEREPVEELAGARRYADASPLVNLYGVVGRFGRRDGLRDLVAHGAPAAWREGPRLAEAAYPDVLVARAVTDGAALDLVLRPGNGPVRVTLGLDRLTPGGRYRVAGGTATELTADAEGRALLEVELAGRHELRVYPA